MDYDQWCEDNYIEHEPKLKLDTIQEIKSEVSFNAGAILMAVDKVINERVNDSLDKFIEEKVNKFFNNHYQSKVKFDEIIHEIIEEKFNKKYPDVVENKINEFENEIKKLKFNDRGLSFSIERISRSAYDRVQKIESDASIKVQEYINNELSKSVTKSNEYIEQFAKNYFAQNLFKAMGMMDKMMPITENVIKN